METLSDLQDQIQRDLAWRKREISDLRGAVQIAEKTDYLCRAGLVLLCAHWEGFLKKVASLYVEHVFAQDVRINQLAPHIVAIAYFDDVMRASEAKYPGSEENHVRLARKIAASFNQRVSVPAWDAHTEGNPGTGVVERIMRSIGLDLQLGMDSALWSTTRVFINEQLVGDRHRVAHGDGFKVGKESVLERSERLLSLLDSLVDLVMHAAEEKAYLGQSVTLRRQ